MGGKWQNQQPAKEHWRYWPGSWSSPKPPWKQQLSSSSTKIPAYDAQKVNVDHSQMHNPETEEDRSDGMIQSLQKAVNAARKAESRVKKVTAERLERQEQWRAWEADLKRTHAKEKQRFGNALVKLEHDLREALHQQEQARANVRNVASGSVTDQMEEITTVTDEEFAALKGTTSPDPWEDSQDAVLQRALAASLQPLPSATLGISRTSLPTTPPTTRSCPRTPVPQRLSSTPQASTATMVAGSSQGTTRPALALGQTTHLRPFPPPMGHMTGLPFGSPTASDPYLFGASAVGDLDPNSIGGTCVSPPNGPPKPPKNRTPVKEAGKKIGPIHPETGGTSRESVLDAKREALTKASCAAPSAQAMQFILHDDDNDTGQQSGADLADATEGVMD